MVRFLAKKEIISSVIWAKEGQVYDFPLDDATQKYWTDCGLIEVLPDEEQPAPVEVQADVTQNEGQ
ncbi:hypothetical protein [Ectobacillus ponti]|uniref:Uncharacterized protein n=1 Tax=Ectobacillus ponti TaxID=2961894 RepID=A0AA41X695_9BACI|nr:hypothetical protein [Ectobacillus ponti]MCP8969719.1 hypothetical protein [Ectobacillus ponti]